MVSRLECANAIRFLSMDAVQKANSGHPGMPMGMADIAEVLWRDYLNINPVNTKWFNRDRFVLSNGHGAMLLYSLLHLTGFDLSLDDLKNFRQFHSKTPGHPEHADTPGVETTTGPLGQGLANAVGMAIAEKALAHQFNRDSFPIVDHYTYAFIGDGCLMEGISHEVCSLAGTLGLGKLIVLWDDNGISIDGDVAGWFTDNTPKRFAAYEWHVVADVDGHDSEAVSKAIALAKENTDKPSIICCRTKIGFGAPTKEGTASTHGAPLGDEEIAATRKALGWEHGSFEIPESIYAAWDKRQAGQELENKWNKLFAQYERANPALATEFLRRQHGDLPEAWYDKAEDFTREVQQAAKANATRKDSLLTLNAFVPLLPEMLGGSADLSGSNLTAWSGASAISKDNPGGDYIHYGVREFGMAAIMNGIALHGGFIPFGGTFLVFADYARNAIRLSALMKQRVIYVLTHDSIGLGEDGPTHQPIEHASMLRITPQVNVWRPCDGVETAVAWQHGLAHQGPSCLLLTRQGVPVQPRTEAAIENIRRGGYVLWESSTDAVDGIIIATGSEVQLAVEAARQLETQGIHMRVVSMPCCELFKSQSVKYQEMILPSAIKKRLAIEAGTSDYWRQFVGIDGRVIGLDSFGMSAPAKEIFAARGFTVSNVIEEIQEMLAFQSVH